MKVNILDKSNIDLGDFISGIPESSEQRTVVYFAIASLVIKHLKKDFKIGVNELKTIDGIKIVNEILYGINELSPINVDVIKTHMEKIINFEKAIVDNTEIAFIGNTFIDNLGVSYIFGENLISIIDRNVETYRNTNVLFFQSEFLKTLKDNI